MIKGAAVIISKWCNLKCPHCLSSSSSLATLETETTAEELIQFFETLPDLKNIRITGGEPFSPPVYDKTYKIVKYCIERGLEVQINTNGTFLPEFDLQSRKISFQVSLDGFKEQHDSYRGEGVFDKACNFIRTYKEKGYKVHTMSVIMEDPDFEYVERFINFIKNDLGVHPKFQVISKVGRGADSDLHLDFDQTVEKVKSCGADCRVRVIKCNTNLSHLDGLRIGIDAEGYIIPCPYLCNHRFGHIRDFNEYKVRIEMMNKLNDVTCSYPNGYRKQ